MPMRTAMKLCPQAITMYGNHAEYSKYSRWVTDIIASKVPLFEKASVDEFYCDLTGMDKYFGISKYTQELRNTIMKETGLPISCGLSTAKFISKMATNEAKPNGFLEVLPGKETTFLWPLPIERINGVGKQTEQVLKTFGLYLIKDVADIPLDILEKYIGPSMAGSLKRKAMGIGSTAISTDWEQKSISHENTFHENITDLNFLHGELVRLTEKTAYGLRQDEKIAGCVTVKIRYDDFETITRQEVIDYTSLDDRLIAKALDIFKKSYQSGRPVRLIGVRFSNLIPFSLQMELFENNAEKLNLYKTVDTIKNRFGSKIVKKASTLRNDKDRQ